MLPTGSSHIFHLLLRHPWVIGRNWVHACMCMGKGRGLALQAHHMAENMYVMLSRSHPFILMTTFWASDRGLCGTGQVLQDLLGHCARTVWGSLSPQMRTETGLRYKLLARHGPVPEAVTDQEADELVYSSLEQQPSYRHISGIDGDVLAFHLAGPGPFDQDDWIVPSFEVDVRDDHSHFVSSLLCHRLQLC